MKKYNIYKTAVCAFVLGLSLSSCGDFLDQPDNSNYNADTFYNGDAECYQGANSLYSMPWYDFQRGFFKVGEVMSGNYYWWGSEDTQYWNCNVSANNANLKDMSYSLWTVNAYANTIYDKLKGASASASVKSACMGECLTWKAGTQNIELLWDFCLCIFLCYIAIRNLSKIFEIRCLCIFVPFGREDATTAIAFQSNPKTAYTGKQIYESKDLSFHGIHLCQQSDG